MPTTVQLPDDLTQHPNPGREALEALAIEGYRSGTLRSDSRALNSMGSSRSARSTITLTIWKTSNKTARRCASFSPRDVSPDDCRGGHLSGFGPMQT
jgi:hypothetical protein